MTAFNSARHSTSSTRSENKVNSCSVIARSVRLKRRRARARKLTTLSANLASAKLRFGAGGLTDVYVAVGSELLTGNTARTGSRAVTLVVPETSRVLPTSLPVRSCRGSSSLTYFAAACKA